MSALYLIDRHASPVSGARIMDVQESTQPPLSGRFVVKVPDGIPILNPVNFSDLITKKAQGFLLFYAGGFTRVTYDDLVDTSNVDLVHSVGGAFGQRSEIVLEAGGVFQSSPTALTGATPTQAVVTWDTFTTIDTDTAGQLYSRQYEELPSDTSHFTCQVSFNGGSTFSTTTDSSVLNLGPSQQGTSFIIQLTNVSGGRLSLGSWSCIY